MTFANQAPAQIVFARKQKCFRGPCRLQLLCRVLDSNARRSFARHPWANCFGNPKCKQGGNLLQLAVVRATVAHDIPISFLGGPVAVEHLLQADFQAFLAVGSGSAI